MLVFLFALLGNKNRARVILNLKTFHCDIQMVLETALTM